MGCGYASVRGEGTGTGRTRGLSGSDGEGRKIALEEDFDLSTVTGTVKEFPATFPIRPTALVSSKHLFLTIIYVFSLSLDSVGNLPLLLTWSTTDTRGPSGEGVSETRDPGTTRGKYPRILNVFRDNGTWSHPSLRTLSSSPFGTEGRPSTPSPPLRQGSGTVKTTGS